MFDKMKQMLEMQRKMQEMKRQLDAATFSVVSADGSVTVSMNGSQEVMGVTLRQDYASVAKDSLEKAIRDAYNRAIKRSHELAAQKMKEITGMNLPGLM